MALWLLLALLSVRAVWGQTVSAKLLPQPPCGADPVPAWPVLGAPAASKLWSGEELGRDWKPPACTGWSAQGFTTLVTTVARFRSEGGSTALLRRIGAITQLAGTHYWS